jgi:hypothetical protein
MEKDDHGNAIDNELLGDLDSDLTDLMGQLAPDGTSFGGTDGDGSDLGFWSYWQETCPHCDSEDITIYDYSSGSSHCNACDTDFDMESKDF